MEDVGLKKSGYEKIKIDKFTESYYLAFLENSPAYSGSCAAANHSKMPYYEKGTTTLRSLSYNWENVRKLATVKYQSLYCFTGWGL